MKILMWVLASLILLAACSNIDPAEAEEGITASATLLSLEEYRQGNSYAFECNTTGFEPHTYAWDFGDGIQRTTRYKGVAHTYFKGGTYTVTCVASDDLVNETSEITITAAVDEYDEYNPAEDTIFDDLGVVDLLSDMDDEFLAYNTTANASIRPERRQPDREEDDEYDDALDFDDYDTADDVPNTTVPNMTQNTTEGIGTTINTTKLNTTLNSTSSNANVTVNTTKPDIASPGPTNSTPLNNTRNDTPIIQILPVNGTGNGTDKGEDGKDEETDTGGAEGIIDAGSDGIVDVKMPYGKLKKVLIADLKLK